MQRLTRPEASTLPRFRPLRWEEEEPGGPRRRPQIQGFGGHEISIERSIFRGKSLENARGIAENNQTSDLRPLEVFERRVEMVMIAAGFMREGLERLQTFASTHFARGTRDLPFLPHRPCIRIYTLTNPIL
jgi:hypothetical protein